MADGAVDAAAPPDARRLVAPGPPDARGGVTARAVVVGALLVPLLVAWAEYVEIKAAGPDMISTSLILCVVFAMIALLGVNTLVHRAAPRAALTGRELLVVYAMGGVGVSPAGIGMLQWLVSALPARAGQGKWAASDHLVPEWTRVTDPDAVRAFYAGRAVWWEHLPAWAGPIALWSAFLLVLFAAMFCVSVLLRRQWVERERLLFPLVQVPLEVLGDIGGVGGARLRLWTNRLFWLGALVPVVLQTLAALHYSFLPTLPFFGMKPTDLPDLQSVVGAAGKPWSAVGYLKMTLYPFVIGLAFLLSLEVSFSCWAFYGLMKLAAVVTFALGLNDGVGADLWNTKQTPRLGDQNVGAFLGLALLSLWLARGHLRDTLRHAFGGGGAATSLDDSGEALLYRAAWIGLAVCAALLVGFGTLVGLPLGLSAAFFGAFLLVVIGFARVRAEAGVPWGYGPPMNVNGLLVDAVGTANWGKEALGGLSTLTWMDSDYRSTQMPYQTEALKIADAAGLTARRLTGALALALVAGIAAAWVSQLALYYHFGGDNGLQRTGQGMKFPNQLAGWLANPRPTDGPRLAESGVGAGIVWTLAALRARFSGFPLHPVGYVVAGTWTMQWLWMPMMIGWAAKALILRYGGMPGYRAALPFFVGLVLGDYAISGALALFYTAAPDVPGYRTFPI